MRWLRRSLPLTALLWLVCGGVSGDASRGPDDVGGLLAWYKIGSIATHPNASRVPTWTDASGNGHDLTTEKNSQAARLWRDRINRRPALVVEQGNRYAVTDPFELQDHTIFILYKTTQKERVLFRSDTDESRGVVLHVEGGHNHIFRSGGSGTPVYGYTTLAELRDEPQLAVLGREGDVLRAFIDGLEASSIGRLRDPIRVGEFFHITYTRQADGDGKGLQIAEMIFYDRFLNDDERALVSDYLVDKYGLTLRANVPLGERLDQLPASAEAGVVRLNSTKGAAVDRDGVVIVWDPPERTGPVFRHEAGEDSSRLYCARDATRVRVYVSVPFEASEPDTVARVLLLRNNEDYHSESGRSEPFGGTGSSARSTVELETTLLMNDGDFFEVIATQETGPEASLKALAGGMLVGEAR